MNLHLIYARAANGVIGLEGRLPWHLPEDLAHFKALTMGMPVIMGRLAACYAIDILNGKTQGGYVNTPTEVVTKDNAGQVLAKVKDLYPKPSDEILKKLGVSSN